MLKIGVEQNYKQKMFHVEHYAKNRRGTQNKNSEDNHSKSQ